MACIGLTCVMCDRYHGRHSLSSGAFLEGEGSTAYPWDFARWALAISHRLRCRAVLWWPSPSSPGWPFSRTNSPDWRRCQHPPKAFFIQGKLEEILKQLIVYPIIYMGFIHLKWCRNFFHQSTASLTLFNLWHLPISTLACCGSINFHNQPCPGVYVAAW